jgi:23S rRNA (adenine2503-C2)-methyltransferase
MANNTRKIIHSALDQSFNIIYNLGTEARWVNRKGPKASIYVSSHDDCRMACKMCHLTTQQLPARVNHVDADMYYSQVFDVVSEAIRSGKMEGIEKINVNFMARGDVFANKFFRRDPMKVRTSIDRAIYDALSGTVENYPEIKLNVSSIFPMMVTGMTIDELVGGYITDETEIPRSTIEVYLSLYTMDEKRRKWLLPSAISSREAMNMVASTSLPCTIHHAYIKDFNDDVSRLVDAIKQYGLVAPRVRHNAVRYNPNELTKSGLLSSRYDISEEAPVNVVYDNVNMIGEALGCTVGKRASKVIERVGMDVKASCGMFMKGA